jgi:hypothetical protein
VGLHRTPGPSLTQQQCDAVRGRCDGVVVVNDAYRLAIWADCLVAADLAWWCERNWVPEFGGETYNGARYWPVFRDESETEIFFWKGWSHMREPQIAPAGCTVVGCNPEYTRRFERIGLLWFGNSGIQALRVAASKGADRILLVGYDCHGTHFFGAHKHPLKQASPEQVESWVERHREIAPTFQAAGIEVINCTEGSAITCYPRGHIEDYLKECA